MTDLTLYDICAEDLEIYASLQPNGEVCVTVAREDVDPNQEVVIYQEVSNIAAWESLAYFARQVLYFDEKIQHELNNER
jgi:hypothetical protein